MRQLESRIAEIKHYDSKTYTRRKSVSEVKDPTEDNVKALKQEHTKEGSLELKETSLDSMHKNLKKESNDVAEALKENKRKLDEGSALDDVVKNLNQEYNSLLEKQKELKGANQWLDRYNEQDQPQRLEMWTTLEQKAKQGKLNGKDKRILYALDEGSNGGDSNTISNAGGTSKKDTITETSLNTEEQEKKGLLSYLKKSEGKKKEIGAAPSETLSKKDDGGLQIIIDQGDKYMKQFVEEYKKNFDGSTNPTASSSSREAGAKMKAIETVANQMENDFKGNSDNGLWEMRKLELYLKSQTDQQVLTRLDAIVNNTAPKEDKWFGSRSQKLYLGALVLGAIGTNLYNYALVRGWEGKH